MENFFDANTFRFIILPLAIFMARLVNEAISTLRILSVAKGNRGIAPLFGFFEILIWVVVIGQVMQNLDNPICYVAYAGGFAAGNYLGMFLEDKLAMGVVSVNVISRKDTTALQKTLRANNYGFTNIDGKDIDGDENMLLIIVKRKELKNVIRIIKEFNPYAFFSIGDIRHIHEGHYPLKGDSYFKAFHGIKSFKPKFIKNTFLSFKKQQPVLEKLEVSEEVKPS